MKNHQTRTKSVNTNSIGLTPFIENEISLLVKKGMYPNKSEFIRYAALRQIKEDKEFV